MKRIGGTDIPKLLGLSPYGDELDVYLRIIEDKETPWNAAMERGAMVEPLLRAHSQRVLGLELETREDDYCAHPELEFAGAQVDDLAVRHGLPLVIEYKSVNSFAKGWGPDGSDEVPEHVRAQVAWEMLCSDRPMCLIVAGFGRDVDDDFCLTNVCAYEIQRDEEFERLCMAVARNFWEQHIIPRVPPSIQRERKRRHERSSVGRR
jgi:predicted phage-related endonuclease